MNRKIKILLWTLISTLLLGAVGWGGWVWYDNNVDRSGWREQDGVTMYADFHGKPVRGWLEVDGSRYYFGDDNALKTGWLQDGGKTYYLNTDGKMQTDWLETAEGRCYFGEDGILRTGWQKIGEHRYYFDDSGHMHTGWLEKDGLRHYFLEDGTLASGWQEMDGSTWYLNENGTPVTGWLEWEENRYCFGEDGLLLTGWQEIGQERYFFGEDGAMQTGWLEYDGSCYYLTEDGTPSTGWTDIEENRYYFNEEGNLHTGWLELGEYRYYLDETGAMVTGKQEIDGKTLYFTPKGIWVLLVNPWNYMPGDYELELVEIENGFYVDADCAEALKTMLEAMRTEGLLPYFTSTYRSEADQQGIWQDYMDRYMAAGYSESQANAMTASYVARPGTSEHHTGLAVDIVGHDYYYSGHPGSTKAVQAWLAEHCWEYGFILRYTEEKRSITGFAPETWHFRYVGVEVSMDMKDTGLCLEEYLGAA